MADAKPGASPTASVEDWLRLQRRLVERTAQYFQGVGELVGEGSVEAREYIERSAKLWADVVGEVGDWLKPPEQTEIRKGDVVLPRVRGEISAQNGTATVRIEIPLAAFGGYAAEDTALELWTDGLARRGKPGRSERPAQILEPDRHLTLPPEPVKRSGSRSVELKVHGVPRMLQPGDVYEGLIWAKTKTENEAGADAAEPQPIAIVELTVV